MASIPPNPYQGNYPPPCWNWPYPPIPPTPPVPPTPPSDSYEGWIQSKWRPLMAFTYMAIILFDFLIAPILNVLATHYFGMNLGTWKPLTMAEGGMFHIAMGAILGVAAWTRGQEKIIQMKTTGNYPPYYDPNSYVEIDRSQIVTRPMARQPIQPNKNNPHPPQQDQVERE